MSGSVFIVVGCPGSGKSWVCEQLGHKFDHLKHDDFIGKDYGSALAEASKGNKPVLAETPFSISQLKEPLEAKGIKVVPVFISEPDGVIEERYLKRNGKPIPTGHLTRQKTYAERAKLYGAFIGTAQEVLEHLKGQ